MTNHELLDAVSPAAERMRRHRERVKLGKIFVRFELTAGAVDRLIDLRWLRPESRHNRDAVMDAFMRFGTHALWPNQRM